MNRNLCTCCFLLIILTITACTVKPEKIILTQSDNLSEIVLSTTDTLTIRLKSNPTTGYEWIVTEIDTSLLTFFEIGYEGKINKGSLVGAGGYSLLSFTAIQRGESELHLTYCQPFDTTSQNQTFHLKIKIK